MRTKALLLGAMIGVASLVSSQAQVYSVNIVGYINVTVYPGWNLLANQLDNGAQNFVKDLIVPPESISVFVFNATTQQYDGALYDSDFGTWDKPELKIAPGAGFFLLAQTQWTQPLTFVGQVMTGPQSTALVGGGWNMVAPIVPQDGDITIPEAQGGMGYVPSASSGDSVFFYNAQTQSYDGSLWDPDFGTWDKQPVTKVGQGIFILRGEAGTWTRNFSVSGN